MSRSLVSIAPSGIEIHSHIQTAKRIRVSIAPSGIEMAVVYYHQSGLPGVSIAPSGIEIFVTPLTSSKSASINRTFGY
ncbi:hypothetical protein BN8_05939 [Fibrisoma limi BUZ 3]|uniref:Uncharacterized protein n=1 Tax=Fibrisoma limi BUZ 3 TaxID=1185876 RepID=I2GRP3_9BACT|nr:hypothetical protein BN8_05939 [Fibrisoma limi BUZ 3]